MEQQEMEARRPNFKVAHNVHVGVLMAPMEVARATRDREGGLYRGLLRWTLCGEVSPAMFDVLQATEMRLGKNERITAFSGPSGLNYALFTQQMAMFQHRYLVPLYDGQVARCMDEVGRLGGLGYSLAGEGDHALVWPSVLGARDVMPLHVLCGAVAEGQEEQAVDEYSRMLAEARHPQRIPSLVQGTVVRHVAVSAIPPLDVFRRLTQQCGAAA